MKKIYLMKPYLILVITGLFVFMLASCNDTPSKTSTEPVSKVKSMQKSVMKVHDEAMAKMDLIYRLRKQVKGIADSLHQDSTTHSKTLKTAYKNIEALELADESMMAWMRSYKAPKGKSESEAMEYLKSEQVKIDEVSKLMNDNIERAERFIEAQIER